MPAAPYFKQDLFKFLTELRAHNKREWFLKNKNPYEQHVRDPVLRFIADLGPGLRKINQHIVVDPSPTKGSMMRIYRDPKILETQKSLQNWRLRSLLASKRERRSHAGLLPYYMHLERRGSLIGAGIWRPEAQPLRKIRDAIVADAKRWKLATSAPQLSSKCKMGGESVQHPPRGYDPVHPLIEDIKRRDFTIGRSLAAEVLGRDVSELTLACYRETGPFMKFLADVVGLA